MGFLPIIKLMLTILSLLILCCITIGNKKKKNLGHTFGIVVKMLLKKPTWPVRVPGLESQFCFWLQLPANAYTAGRQWWFKLVGDPACVSCSWLHPGPISAAVGTWRMNQQMGVISFSFFPFQTAIVKRNNSILTNVSNVSQFPFIYSCCKIHIWDLPTRRESLKEVNSLLLSLGFHHPGTPGMKEETCQNPLQGRILVVK